MSYNLDNFVAKSTDFRAAIRKNQQRTFMIIAIFIGIYLALGLLVDLFIAAGRYPTATFPDLVKGFATLQIFPLATVVMLAVAGISLVVTISMSNQLMLLGTEYREITPETAQNEQETQLYNIIEELKIAAGLAYMPKVFIIEADYMNAFASGFNEKSAMVAITRGLLTKLNRSEVQAVMAHEMSHIRHLDIKVTLMASVLTNLILMVLDVFFYSAIYGGNDGRESETRSALVPIILILRWVLPLINVLMMLYLSRTREYMADAGCVELMRDNQPLVSALLKIENDGKQHVDQYRQEYGSTAHENVRREAYIYDPVQAGLEPASSIADMFSTHPDIVKRLAALGYQLKS